MLIKHFTYFFHRKRIKTYNLKLTISQGTLNQTYLGLIIDNKLNCASRIAHVKNKIPKCVSILMKARPGLSRKCLLDLYYSFAVWKYTVWKYTVWKCEAVWMTDFYFHYF